MAIVYHFKMTGLKEATANLNKAIAAIPFKVKGGLIKAAFLIQREAMKIVPVDTGNLRSSAFVVWDTGGRALDASTRFVPNPRKGPGEQGQLMSDHAALVYELQRETRTAEPSVAVGFSAYYAAIQHEKFEKKRNPLKEWKYLESAIKRNQAAILDEIRRTVK